jgi:hypothetical protein
MLTSVYHSISLRKHWRRNGNLNFNAEIYTNLFFRRQKSVKLWTEQCQRNSDVLWWKESLRARGAWESIEALICKRWNIQYNLHFFILKSTLIRTNFNRIDLNAIYSSECDLAVRTRQPSGWNLNLNWPLRDSLSSQLNSFWIRTFFMKILSSEPLKNHSRKPL